MIFKFEFWFSYGFWMFSCCSIIICSWLIWCDLCSFCGKVRVLIGVRSWKWQIDWKKMRKMRDLYGIFSNYPRTGGVLTATVWYVIYCLAGVCLFDCLICWFYLVIYVLNLVPLLVWSIIWIILFFCYDLLSCNISLGL